MTLEIQDGKSNWSLRFAIVVLCLLFIPSKDEWYRIYTLANFIIPVALLFNPQKIENSKYFRWISLWIVFFFLTTFVKFIILPPQFELFRELTELFRFLIIIPFVIADDRFFSKRNFDLFIAISVIYILFDFLVTSCETGFLPRGGFLSLIKGIYHSKAQDGLNYLAKGVSSHGADHGVMMNFYIAIFLFLLNKKGLGFFKFCILIMCLYGLVASGSRTNMIGLVFSLLMFFFLMFLRERKAKVSPWFGLLCVILVLSVGYFIQSGEFIRLQLLLEHGTNTTSYQIREQNWDFFMKTISQHWYLFFIGWGKTIFIMNGKSSFYTDNEYFTYFIIHGLLVFFILLFLLIRFQIRTFLEWSNANTSKKMLFLALCCFLLVSTSSMGFSSPKLIALLLVLYRFSTCKYTFENELGFRT